MGNPGAPIPPDEFERRIAQLQDEVDAARAELAHREAELAWWVQGRALFVQNGSGPAEKPSKPTLRQAIKRVMREGEQDAWRAADVESVLAGRGWMPSGKNASQRVGDMLSMLTNKGELVRVGRGLYSVPERAPKELMTGS